MANTMGTHNTQAQGSDVNDQLDDRQEQMAHTDDPENTKRVSPNQAMHTQNVTTADDARAQDQRFDGNSPQVSGGQTQKRDDLGTPVKNG